MSLVYEIALRTTASGLPDVPFYLHLTLIYQCRVLLPLPVGAVKLGVFSLFLCVSAWITRGRNTDVVVNGKGKNVRTVRCVLPGPRVTRMIAFSSTSSAQTVFVKTTRPPGGTLFWMHFAVFVQWPVILLHRRFACCSTATFLRILGRSFYTLHWVSRAL